MELIDIVIIGVLLLFALVGFNRGIFKSIIVFLGFVITLFAAYALKNVLGDILVLNLPFIKFGIALSGLSTLNIIMYQTLAFIIILIILGLVYRFIVTISGVFERTLNLTVILGLFSKLAGAIFGFLEGLVIVYLVLFFLNQPFVNMDILDKSNLSPKILNDTPIITGYADESLMVINEVKAIIDSSDNEEKNLKIAELILKRRITSPSVMQELLDSNKLDIDGLQELIDKYQ